ncbi:MAG: HAMP domain-containing histidine kinase [Catenulispora sp.]|nr:HAMP domain-containing histidine kinase [Catenulispora sp.]
MVMTWRPRTVRTRLTLLYTVLFLTSGLLLVSLVLFLMFRQPILATFAPDSPKPKGMPGVDDPFLVISPPQPQNDKVAPTWNTLRAAMTQSAIVLLLMGVGSAVLGWTVAGWVLSPLRTMTAKTRRISEHNLHERLALSGPKDELTELSDTVDGLLARLECAFEAQRRFVANASHELRTPLAMMRTSVDVAVAKPGRPAEVAVLAGKLHEGLEAADRLLEGLLLLARAQNAAQGDGHAEADWVPVACLAASALQARSAAVAEKRLTVEHAVDADPTSMAGSTPTSTAEGAVEPTTLEPGADPLTVWGNPTLLACLVDNLIDNAVRHNEPGGFLRIAVSPRVGGHRLRLTVENGGPVLGQDRVALLGQPFQRLGADRTSREGTGLGLSIAAAITAAHRGRLLLYARPQGGLRVEVEL